MKNSDKISATIAYVRSKHPGKKIGLLGEVGGSWRNTTNQPCGCGETEKIVAWENVPIKYCIGCSATKQLTLFNQEIKI
jgi:hypothetical protein